eukprot:9402903-Lingulodinium_polyedra.AAC.1
MVYNAYRHAREVKHLGAEWSNDSLPVARHSVNRAYDAFTDCIHFFVPARDIDYVGADKDWPDLRN